MQVLQNQLTELQVFDTCIFTYNGQEALNAATSLIKQTQQEFPDLEKIQPIKLCLFDFQMPRLNGLQTMQQLCSFIKNTNAQSQRQKIIEPHFVFCTAFLTSALRKHIAQENMVFEKPMEFETLQAVLREVERAKDH